MKIEITPQFQQKLRRQLIYISFDKPFAAKNFSKLIYSEIRKIINMPYKHKQSKFFDNKNFRELIVKGYAINFEIIPDKNKIVVFGLHKWEDELNL